MSFVSSGMVDCLHPKTNEKITNIPTSDFNGQDVDSLFFETASFALGRQDGWAVQCHAQAPL